MTDVGSKQRYTGVEHKKKRLVDKEDGEDKKEKEMRDGDDIFS